MGNGRGQAVPFGDVRLLPKRAVGGLIEALGRIGPVYGPVERPDGTCAFDRVEDAGSVRPECVRTALPPKKLVFPFEHELFKFSPDQGYSAPEDGERLVLFGVHPCDINALLTLDAVFSGEFPDRNYLKTRERMLVVGHDCMPDELCFCQSTGTDFAQEGYDLFLTDLGDDYLVHVGTSAGNDILESIQDETRPVDADAVERYKRRVLERSRSFTNRVNAGDLPHLIELGYESPVWEEEGDKCFGCGNCSAVCPTCYCYDVYDVVDFNADSGSRIRRWDSCMFKEFAVVAGGHDFRPERALRLKLRFHHKHVATPREHGRPGCVGCGRCIAACPADIDFSEIMRKLGGERVMVDAG